MSTLQDALGLDALLASAESRLSGWGLTHPELGRLSTLDEVIQASNTGTPAARDEVLFRLAELAHVGHGDDPAAAAVLCRLLVPGVIGKLGCLTLPATTDHVNELAAAHLWVQSRTFPCDRRPKVAPTIVWNVRRAVLADLGIGDPSRGDRTWANTSIVDQQHLDYLVEPEVQEDADEELADLLARACWERRISGEQMLLLLTLLQVAQQAAGKRVTRHGLLSDEVSRLVGLELGIGASTVRARVNGALGALRVANRDAA